MCNEVHDSLNRSEVMEQLLFRNTDFRIRDCVMINDWLSRSRANGWWYLASVAVDTKQGR